MSNRKKDDVADRDCDSRGGLRLFESIPYGR